MTELPLLSVRQLSIHFNTEKGQIPAVDKVSFDVYRGKITALVGESGSGKSVTALSILKLLPEKTASYTEGQILFSRDGISSSNILAMDGQEVQKLRGDRISMVFQEPMTSLNPLMPCGQQVAENMMLHKGLKRKQAIEKVEKLFAQVQLPDPAGMLKRYPHELSGGQKQRVMIAMAMGCEPDLLIADEPTTALDVTVQKNILGLIRELQRSRNMGVIFITHDLGLVSEIADQVVVMYKGAVVEKGACKEILKDPRHPYTKALLACRPLLHQPGERLPLVSDFLGTGKENDQAERLLIKERSGRAVKEDSTPILEVKDLKVWFPVGHQLFGRTKEYVRAVDGVSFSMSRAETLGVVGESGCGKTTLGRALLRLIDPSSGTIIYNGRNITGLDKRKFKPYRKDIQIIFQDPYSSLNPRIAVGQAITEVMDVHGIGTPKQRPELAVELLEKVGLGADHFRRYPHEFSGGQRQRIGIARALALNPSFLVCDESVSALDVSVQAQVLNLLNDLKKEYGFTIVFISHDLSVVHYFSDRIMVMNKGRIEELGPAGQVFYHPAKEYTQKLIEAIPGRH